MNELNLIFRLINQLRYTVKIAKLEIRMCYTKLLKLRDLTSTKQFFSYYLEAKFSLI